MLLKLTRNRIGNCPDKQKTLLHFKLFRKLKLKLTFILIIEDEKVSVKMWQISVSDKEKMLIQMFYKTCN